MNGLPFYFFSFFFSPFLSSLLFLFFSFFAFSPHAILNFFFPFATSFLAKNFDPSTDLQIQTNLIGNCAPLMPCNRTPYYLWHIIYRVLLICAFWGRKRDRVRHGSRPMTLNSTNSTQCCCCVMLKCNFNRGYMLYNVEISLEDYLDTLLILNARWNLRSSWLVFLLSSMIYTESGTRQSSNLPGGLPL